VDHFSRSTRGENNENKRDKGGKMLSMIAITANHKYTKMTWEHKLDFFKTRTWEKETSLILIKWERNFERFFFYQIKVMTMNVITIVLRGKTR